MSGATGPQAGKGTGTFRRSKAPTPPGGPADPLEHYRQKLNPENWQPHIRRLCRTYGVRV